MGGVFIDVDRHVQLVSPAAEGIAEFDRLESSRRLSFDDDWLVMQFAVLVVEYVHDSRGDVDRRIVRSRRSHRVGSAARRQGLSDGLGDAGHWA